MVEDLNKTDIITTVDPESTSPVLKAEGTESIPVCGPFDSRPYSMMNNGDLARSEAERLVQARRDSFSRDPTPRSLRPVVERRVPFNLNTGFSVENRPMNDSVTEVSPFTFLIDFVRRLFLVHLFGILWLLWDEILDIIGYKFTLF